jgi:antibiotic biosynthesis monooxygenase
MSIHDLTTDCHASVVFMVDARLQPGRPSNHREATMSTPVVVLAYFRPAPGQRDQVVETLRQAISAVHQESGCELYAIHDAPTAPSS